MVKTFSVLLILVALLNSIQAQTTSCISILDSVPDLVFREYLIKVFEGERVY